ncbi:hypothetical protein LINPERHAP2_LOCUS3664 [Linum perenne]
MFLPPPSFYEAQYSEIAFLSSEDQPLRSGWISMGSARRKQEATSAKGNNRLTSWCRPGTLGSRRR